VAVVEQAPTRTRRVDVARVVLLPLAGLLWLLGWLAGTIWSAVLWSGAAIKLGWTDSRAVSRRR
jgi:hypothetical protein